MEIAIIFLLLYNGFFCIFRDTLNNIFDGYSLTTSDDTTCKLEFKEETNYPSTVFVNPGESNQIDLIKLQGIELEDIKYLTIKLVLSEIIIVLKKIQ